MFAKGYVLSIGEDTFWVRVDEKWETKVLKSALAESELDYLQEGAFFEWDFDKGGAITFSREVWTQGGLDEVKRKAQELQESLGWVEAGLT